MASVIGLLFKVGRRHEAKSIAGECSKHEDDLTAGEKATFVLNLHGGGSCGNWTRHYFPLLDLKDKYRLVVATPNSPTRAWSEADDEHLRNIVTFVATSSAKTRSRRSGWQDVVRRGLRMRAPFC